MRIRLQKRVKSVLVHKHWGRFCFKEHVRSFNAPKNVIGVRDGHLVRLAGRPALVGRTIWIGVGKRNRRTIISLPQR